MPMDVKLVRFFHTLHLPPKKTTWIMDPQNYGFQLERPLPGLFSGASC